MMTILNELNYKHIKKEQVKDISHDQLMILLYQLNQDHHYGDVELEDPDEQFESCQYCDQPDACCDFGCALNQGIVIPDDITL